MIELSDVLGCPVTAADGTVIGRLVDLVTRLDSPHPGLDRVGIGRGHQVRTWVEWAHVEEFGRSGVKLAADATLSASPDLPALAPDEIRLERDVLDTQILDDVGTRLVRVGDVLLTDPAADGEVRVVGVEVGAGSLVRRLGGRRLSHRFSQPVIDWSGIRLASSRGLATQLAADEGAGHPLGAVEIAAIVTNLSTEEAVKVLEAARPELAADALRVAHPAVSARLMESLSDATVVETVTRMRPDDATAALRGLRPDEVERLLGQVGSGRAEVLRRLLRHRPDTAGGLMTTSVHVAHQGDTLEDLQARFAADPNPPGSRANIFVVDEDGRPVGIVEPMSLITGRAPSRPVPVVPTSLPVERVIDYFALNDVPALPVVDDDGLLVGAIDGDDVLAELLAERLPGHRRFPHLKVPSPLKRRRRSRR